jgi:hypothetical protein
VKKLLVVVVAVAAALAALRVHQVREAPARVLAAYADAVAYGRHDLARTYATGELAGEEGGERFAVAGWVPVQEIRRISYAVTSRTPAADGGEVVLEATQTVAFNPPGVESALRAAMRATFRLRATVRRVGGGWKVAAFSSELVDAGDAR